MIKDFSKEAFDNGSVSVVINQVEVGQTSFESKKDIYNAILESNVFHGGALCED